MARAFFPLLVCAVILLAPFETAAAWKVASAIHCVHSASTVFGRGEQTLNPKNRLYIRQKDTLTPLEESTVSGPDDAQLVEDC